MNSVACQPAFNSTEKIAAPDSIHENTDFHTAFLRGSKRICKIVANLICPKNIGAQHDGMTCSIDRFKHNRIGIVPVMQAGHGVPLQQRPLRQPSQHSGKRAQIAVHDMT